ncbi:MAG: hypothetical protein WAN93_01560, partial [Solirubrobacteraceae bacterium]
MTTDQGQPTTATQPHAQPEPCAGCGATLADDQRYCLQCGARRGKPRIDFTAFWKPLSPTRASHEQPEDTTALAGGVWASAKAPSRRLAGALAAGMLAGLIVGAALGPTPASSPADSSTLAQRAIAALSTRASSASQASPPSGATQPS